MESLNRFITAQEIDYDRALSEIKSGRKLTHWIWYIFPQIAGLGQSPTAKMYEIKDREEAEAYLAHPILGARLIEISRAMLQIQNRTALQILGTPDDMKLRSCMTLFNSLPEADGVFKEMLKKYFNGMEDEQTLDLLKGN